MNNSIPDDWRPADHGLPEDFVPPPGVRYLVHGNVLTILDDRPWNKGPRPMTEHEREQIRLARRKLGLEGPPEEPPPPANS
jgi:hypothetical protein